MTYTLVKTVDVLPDGVEPLVVEGRNKMIPPFISIFLHEILVMVYGYTIQLQTNLELVVGAGGLGGSGEVGWAMGGRLQQVKPGLCVPWEGPCRGCLVLEVRISATLPSWGEVEGAVGLSKRLVRDRSRERRERAG